MDGHRLIFGSLMFAAISTFCVPFITSLGLLAFTVSLQGIAMGAMDVGGNVMLLWLHPEFCDPYLQMIHCSFGVGATVTPLVLGAFMAANENSITVPFCVLSLLVVPILVSVCITPSPTNPIPASPSSPAATKPAPAPGGSEDPAITTDGTTATNTSAGAGDSQVPALFVSASSGNQSWDRLKAYLSHYNICDGFSANDRSVIAYLSIYLGVVCVSVLFLLPLARFLSSSCILSVW
jgi:MFS family permease